MLCLYLRMQCLDWIGYWRHDWTEIWVETLECFQMKYPPFGQTKLDVSYYLLLVPGMADGFLRIFATINDQCCILFYFLIFVFYYYLKETWNIWKKTNQLPPLCWSLYLPNSNHSLNHACFLGVKKRTQGEIFIPDMDAQPFCKRDTVIILFKLHLLSHTAIIVRSILVCVLTALQYSTQWEREHRRRQFEFLVRARLRTQRP